MDQLEWGEIGCEVNSCEGNPVKGGSEAAITRRQESPPPDLPLPPSKRTLFLTWLRAVSVVTNLSAPNHNRLRRLVLLPSPPAHLTVVLYLPPSVLIRICTFRLSVMLKEALIREESNWIFELILAACKWRQKVVSGSDYWTLKVGQFNALVEKDVNAFTVFCSCIGLQCPELRKLAYSKVGGHSIAPKTTSANAASASP